jgi:flagellar biosynthesis GTPase FlhF
MIRKIFYILLFLSFTMVNCALAGTIYTWTDADGVKRYSNAAPPEGAEHVRTIEEVQTNQDTNDRVRQDYDRMVEEASQEADRHFEEQAEKKAQAAEAARNRKQEMQAQQVDQEREKLQKEIEALQNRGLSRTFSAGQKEYLIKQLQDQIDQLDNNP